MNGPIRKTKALGMVLNGPQGVRTMSTKETLRRVTYIALGTVLFAWILQNLSFVEGTILRILTPLNPLFLGSAVAFILNIPMSALEQRLKMKSRKLKRGLSLLITLLGMILLLVLILFIVLPEIGRTFENLASMLPGFVEKITLWAENLSVNLPSIQKYLQEMDITLESISQDLLNLLKVGGTNIANYTLTLISRLVSGTVTVFISFVFTAYILLDKENLSRQGRRLIYAFLPEKRADWVMETLGLTSDVFSKFVTGQLTEAVILGLMFFVSMAILGFPYAMVISVLVSITALIPLIGAFVATAVGAFLILITNPLQALWFVILAQVLQQVEGNLVYPRVVGNSVGLPGIWVLAAILLATGLFGIVGILLSVPVCSVLYTLLKRHVASRLAVKEKEKSEAQV